MSLKSRLIEILLAPQKVTEGRYFIVSKYGDDSFMIKLARRGKIPLLRQSAIDALKSIFSPKGIIIETKDNGGRGNCQEIFHEILIYRPQCGFSQLPEFLGKVIR